MEVSGSKMGQVARVALGVGFADRGTVSGE